MQPNDVRLCCVEKIAFLRTTRCKCMEFRVGCSERPLGGGGRSGVESAVYACNAYLLFPTLPVERAARIRYTRITVLHFDSCPRAAHSLIAALSHGRLVSLLRVAQEFPGAT